MKKLLSIMLIVVITLLAGGSFVFAANNNGQLNVSGNAVDYTEDDDEKGTMAQISNLKESLTLSTAEEGFFGTVANPTALAGTAIASGFFSAQKGMTYMTCSVVNLAHEANFLGKIAENLEELMSPGMKSLFSWSGNKNGTSVVLLLTAFAIIGAAILLFSGKVSEAAGRILKIALVSAISILLISSSATLFDNFNDTTTTLSNDFVEATTDSSTDMMGVVWDINVVRPWKILNFGDALAGSGHSVENGGLSSSSVEFKMRSTLAKDANGVIWNVDDYKNASGKVGDYNTHNSAKIMMFGNEEKKQDVVDEFMEVNSEANDGFGYFALDASVQWGRTTTAAGMFICSMPLNIVVFLMGILILAFKTVGMLLIFLWPIILLYVLFSAEGINVLKKWLATIAGVFILSVVVEFLLAIITAAMVGLFGSAVRQYQWFVMSIVGMIMIVAVVLLRKPLMKIFKIGIRRTLYKHGGDFTKAMMTMPKNRGGETKLFVNSSGQSVGNTVKGASFRNPSSYANGVSDEDSFKADTQQSEKGNSFAEQAEQKKEQKGETFNNTAGLGTNDAEEMSGNNDETQDLTEELGGKLDKVQKEDAENDIKAKGKDDKDKDEKGVKLATAEKNEGKAEKDEKENTAEKASQMKPVGAGGAVADKVKEKGEKEVANKSPQAVKDAVHKVENSKAGAVAKGVASQVPEGKAAVAAVGEADKIYNKHDEAYSRQHSEVNSQKNKETTNDINSKLNKPNNDSADNSQDLKRKKAMEMAQRANNQGISR